MINDIIEELREMPDGTETTVYRLVEQCGYDAKELELNDEMFTVYSDLCKAARKAHIKLDWSAYKDMVVGLPYNIPFVVRNAKAQIKCPRCGSTNTARIMYGLPAFDEELMHRIDAGRIQLGGCCITGFDAKRYCNDCKKSFGAEAQIANGEELEVFADVVTEVQFSRTVYLRPFPPTQLTIRKTDKGAHVKVCGNDDYIPFEKEYDISAKKWDAFVGALYYDLYLNDWKHSFNDYNVLDGEEWQLTIKLTNHRKRTYSGMNGYPPYWEELVKLLKPFMKSSKTNKDTI